MGGMTGAAGISAFLSAGNAGPVPRLRKSTQSNVTTTIPTRTAMINLLSNTLAPDTVSIVPGH
jgi:hypothetical protein